MWTKRDIITEAYSELGLADYVYSLSANQLGRALRRLDIMVASWGNIGVRLGYPLPDGPNDSNLDASSNLYDGDVEAVVYKLAQRLAPGLGKSLSPETKKEGEQAYQRMLQKYTHTQKRAFPTTLPVGQGTKYWRNDRNPFIREPEPEVASGSDDILEI